MSSSSTGNVLVKSIEGQTFLPEKTPPLSIPGGVSQPTPTIATTPEDAELQFDMSPPRCMLSCVYYYYHYFNFSPSSHQVLF